MKTQPFSKEHFFGLAESDLHDAEVLFKANSFRRGVNVLAEADEMVAKGLLCDIGFVYDQQDMAKIREGMAKSGIVPPAGIETIIRLMEETAKENKKKLLLTYGHEWTTNFLSFLLQIAQPVADTATQSGFEGMFPLPSQTPWLASIWNFEGSKERVEKVREALRDRIRFRNPTVGEIEQVLFSDNKLLDSIGAYSTSDEATKALYEKMFGAPIPPSVTVTGKMLKEAIAKSMQLTVAGDLSVYLSCHFQLARYLDEPVEFAYDESLAVVKKRNDIAKLLRRCMEVF